MIICCGGTLNGQIATRWMKTDTLGISFFYKEFPYWVGNTNHTAKTFNNKFVSVAMEGDFWIYLYKLNSNLDYDSVYTHQFIYDSLCPGGVISDTIDPNCDLIVGIDDQKVESESSRMKIFPNPASEWLTVEFPEYIKQIERKSGITSSSVYYQWKNSTLEVFNIEGKKILEKEIPKSMTELVIDISSWTRGIYLFRLTWNHEIIANVKEIIQ